MNRTSKRDTIIYWLTTGAVCVVMVFSAVNFNLKEPLGPMKGAFTHLGYPSYFRIELTVAKALFVIDPLLFLSALIASYALFLNRLGDQVPTGRVLRKTA